jgi:hypothetical protein
MRFSCVLLNLISFDISLVQLVSESQMGILSFDVKYSVQRQQIGMKEESNLNSFLKKMPSSLNWVRIAFYKNVLR